MEILEAASSQAVPWAPSAFGPPDPLLSANVYCAGRLDDLLVRGIAPFWRAWCEGHGESGSAFSASRRWRLWFVRYRRGGDHLKLRIHGPQAEAPLLREELSRAVESYFALLPPPTPAEMEQPRGRMDVPPIDPEDRVAADYPDRSLLFTTYERSFVSFGGPPLMGDDRYVSSLIGFLSGAAEQLLYDLKLDASGSVPHQKRQTLLMKMVIGSLATLAFSEEQRTGYLRHHRDWLLRFALNKALDRREKGRELIGKFEQQVARMGAGTGPIERTLVRVWDGPGREEEVPGPLRSLADHLEGFRGNLSYQLDPFTEEPAFTGLFKALHTVANQLGLPMVEEAFTYHLLLQVRNPEKAAGDLLLMPA